jgi:GGDEF domain-containing protein
MVMAQIELQHAFGRVDPLSGLPNRNQFAEDLEDLARDHPGEQRFAVLVDLVGTTQLTEALRVMGPSFIDDIIRASKSTLRAALPAGTRLYQIGSTHFAYLAGDAEPAEVAHMAELARNKLEAVIQSNGVPVSVDPALGIAPFKLGEARPRDVLRTAHSAAQDARDAETGLSIYSTDLDDAHRRRFTLLADFRAALLSGDQLSLVYQPRIDVRLGSCLRGRSSPALAAPRSG